ncbi:MAG: carboxypeptidase regulatory-like domain-containing protein [Thermoleophilia bacterium]|nr:carboxypeptidase regulatory-like domain-containing protein [Thermoleophilia bacterium]
MSTRRIASSCPGRRRVLAGEAGITLVEMLIASALLLVIATALGTVLTSSIASHRLSREKTIADEVALQEIESIRRLPYDSVGVVSGNPPGTVTPVKTVSVRGLDASVSIQITYVNDPTPTSYATAANYKRVVVTVTRTRDGKQLARQATYVAPPARAPYGGINYAIVNAQVVDAGSSTPVAGVTVLLGTGPSAPRSDVTGETGIVTFAALTANPESGPDAYYDLTLNPPTGYVVLAEDVPPGGAAHTQLAPGQTFDTALRIYRPATIEVDLRGSDGSTYAGAASVTISSARGSETFEYGGGPLTVTEVAGEPVVPGLDYTVSAVGEGGVEAEALTKYVPDDYPTDLSSSFTLTFPPVGAVVVSVGWAGSPVPGATVTVEGGSVSLTGTTDGAGMVTFPNVPAGTGYLVTASAGGASASATADVVEGETTTISLSLPVGGVAVSVAWAGTPVSGASVTLSGGPQGISVSGTTDGNGMVTFVNVPAGSGYTAAASKSGQSTSAGVSVADGQTTPVALNLPTGTVVATVTWAGLPVTGANVTLSGGPMGISVSGTSNSSGSVTFSNVPAGSGYSVAASKSGQSASASATVTGGGTASVSLGLPTGSLQVRVKRGSSDVSGATVKLSGGPMGILATGTSGSGGLITFTNVPVGTPYTVKAWKCSVSNPKSVTNSSVTVNAGSNSITVTFSTNTCPLP